MVVKGVAGDEKGDLLGFLSCEKKSTNVGHQKKGKN